MLFIKYTVPVIKEAPAWAPVRLGYLSPLQLHTGRVLSNLSNSIKASGKCAPLRPVLVLSLGSPPQRALAELIVASFGYLWWPALRMTSSYPGFLGYMP